MNEKVFDLLDYDNCIANLTNSVYKYFGVEPVGASLPLLDAYLQKKYRNVVVLLLDGMGINILEANAEANGFFRSHLAGTFASTFPPTTVAATTSVLSGLMPSTHAWLGWDCYYPQIGKNVVVYRNTIQDTDIPAAEENVAWTYTPYENICKRFARAGKTAHIVSPFYDPFPEDFPAVLARVELLCREPGEKYIYAYWSEPDHTMHMTGCYSEDSRQILRSLEAAVEELCARLEDTLVVVTADHGHRNGRGAALTDYPSLMECLERLPAIEPRALNFFLKKGKEEQFVREFTKLFGDKFLLLSKEEVLKRKLFGTGPEHPCFRAMLGDYLAIATGDLSIFNTPEIAKRFIGIHAGLTEEEMRIPLVVWEGRR